MLKAWTLNNQEQLDRLSNYLCNFEFSTEVQVGITLNPGEHDLICHYWLTFDSFPSFLEVVVVVNAGFTVICCEHNHRILPVTMTTELGDVFMVSSSYIM